MNHPQLLPARRSLLAAAPVACLLAAACASCTWFAKPGPPTDPLYQQATKQFLGQNYPSAMATYTKYIESNKGSDYAADAYYGRGMCSFAQGNYFAARQDFERALSKTNDKDLQATILLRLGECYMREERFKEAEDVYNRLLKKFPYSAKRDDVLYFLGVACLRQAKWDEAENYLGQVIRNYPYSTRKPLAQEKMPAEDRFFSVQVGAYQTRDKALAIQQDLSKRGLDSFIRVINRSGTTYYCVRTGRFASWDEVKQHAQRLEVAGFKDILKVP
ncbi:MAG: tetratricopeptide repeat protein [Planctomycetota bacterium]